MRQLKMFVCALTASILLVACGGNNAPPTQNFTLPRKSIGYTPEQLERTLATGLTAISLAGPRAGKDEDGSATTTYSYEKAGRVKTVLNKDGEISTLLAICGYGREENGTTLQMTRLALGVLFAIAPEKSEDEAKKIISDLLTKADRNHGKTQKISLNGLLYGVSVVPTPAMVLISVSLDEKKGAIPPIGGDASLRK